MKTNHATVSHTALILYAILMIVIIVAVDIIFFRHHFRERLLANIAIVFVFLIAYLTLVKR